MPPRATLHGVGAAMLRAMASAWRSFCRRRYAGRRALSGVGSSGSGRGPTVGVRGAGNRRYVDGGAGCAKLELAEAQLDAALGRYKASYAAAERALAHYRKLGHPLGTSEAQQYAGRALAMLGRLADGEALLNEALIAARALGARKLSGWTLQSLGDARRKADDLAAARVRYADALDIAKASGGDRLAAQVLANLAEVEFRAGDAPMALRLAGEALAADRALNDKQRVAMYRCNMAAYHVTLGRHNEARSQALEALTVLRDARAEVYFAFALHHLAAVAALRPNDDAKKAREGRMRAARLLGYLDARLTGLEASRVYTEQQEYDKMLAVLRDALGKNDCTKLMEEGRAWSEDQAVTEALLV